MILRNCLAKLATLLLPCLLTAAFAFSFAAAALAKEAAVGTSTPIQVEINKGELVRLEHAAATVFVADPDIADIQVKSPTLVYVFAKKVGETTIFAVDDHEHVLLDAPITVTHDLSRLNGALKSLLPGTDVAATSVDGAILLSGAVDTEVQAEDARRLSARFISKDDEVINRVAVIGPNQVNLRVRVAEVSRDALKDFGINWDSLFNLSGFVFGLGVGTPFVAQGLVPRSPDSTFNNLFVQHQTSNMNLNALIDALASEGLVSVLAEPNLTALSGESANFLAGGEFPIPVPQTSSGGGTIAITVEYKKFGVSLSFTPTILDSGHINLKVVPEVSELSDTGAVNFNGFVIPALNERRAETTVELGSGQSFAIAGLFQNNTRQNLSKFPGLGDLPVLGPLFRSTKFQRQETELVIVVTPYIVRPVASAKMALPTDGMVSPTDYDRVLYGRTYRQQLQGASPQPVAPNASQGLSGPVGFVLDQ